VGKWAWFAQGEILNSPEKSSTVAIIGAGASGLMAAVFAARVGVKVVLFEKGPKPLRKVLASGNGKCNLTNTSLKPENFHTQNPAAAFGVIKRFDDQAVRLFFDELGLLTKAEAYGRVLTMAEEARGAAEVLLHEAARLGIELKRATGVSRIIREPKGFSLKLDNGTAEVFQKVVIATGGPSHPQLGGTFDGLNWAESLGLKIVPVSPAVAGLQLEGNWFNDLQGVRVDAELKVDGSERRYFGEMLFNQHGVSGDRKSVV
jgi:predicted Rossmann fold flavoprotein